ncbi:lactococcin 972 family bacteriocin [Salinactinospora qingdaonensis]|uniref:lactococcin 972 family bacteriocin n=1 Tax=Salinactinospora qingdaonensis TaxID=702744 RepID=UPI0031F055B4
MLKDTMRRVVTPVLMGGAIAAVAGGAAFAVTEYPEGGVWEHGVEYGTVYSNYYHSSTCHSSTAVGDYTDRDTAGAGEWSYASAPKTSFIEATAYSTSC